MTKHKIMAALAAATLCLAANADDGSALWLGMEHRAHIEKIRSNDNSAVAKTAVQELTAYWHGGSVTLKKDGNMPDNDGFAIERPNNGGTTIIRAHRSAGLLYGAYELLRMQQTSGTTVEERSEPAFEYRVLNHWDNPDGSVELFEYSPFANSLFGVPSRGKTGSLTLDVSNNIEMKIKSDKDSTGYKKISIIDELGFNMGYNMADKLRPWSDLQVRLRLKWWKNYTFNLNAVFATYAYDLDENGNPYVGTHTEYSRGRFGRFQGMSQNISFTLTPEPASQAYGYDGHPLFHPRGRQGLC